ncbi:MAG TPA: MoaD/ThiS family protein [Spirochaetia bacterium]|nr:MoaD/ThiS family protein [Spirochaetia bacterium]
MKVQVRLYAALPTKVPEAIQYLYPTGVRAGYPIEVELPDASTIEELISHLQLRSEWVLNSFVNGKSQKLDARLSPGDQVGIFPPIGGG